MNRKGFTLVELLAMMVVLSILMFVAVPNIVGILQKNRESKGIEDVNNLINGAKSKISSEQAKNPKSANGCALMTLDFIDNAQDLTTGQNGSKYNRIESFVVIKKEQHGLDGDLDKYFSYQYYFRLVEQASSIKYYILGLDASNNYISIDEFKKNPQPPTMKPSLDNSVSSLIQQEDKIDELKSLVNHGGLACSDLIVYNSV